MSERWVSIPLAAVRRVQVHLNSPRRSLAEHGAAMGAPVPKWLLRLLAVSKDAIDNAGETLAGEEEMKK